MENIKFNFIHSQAKSIYQYNSLQTKILKCNANIMFNKQCLSKNLIPKYANIKIPRTSKAASFTQTKTHTIRIKDEIRFLYMKKTLLNKSLYIAHLKVAQEWGDTWPLIRDYIHNSINTDMAKKYNTQEKKIKKLENTKNNDHKHLHSFHPRVINKTNINFSTNELNLLNKGLKYNLPYKQKNWISTLAIEAETVITQLPGHHQECLRAIIQPTASNNCTNSKPTLATPSKSTKPSNETGTQ